MIAIYARQSIDKKDSISIESQIDFCKKEFTSEDYKVYTDKGFSGGNTNRPQFENLIKDIRHGHISKVVVYKLDRISRSILDFAKIIEIFKKNHVEFISATEKFDTSTPMGNAMLNITMVFAQLERETIQRRIKDNYYARGKKGFFMGGPPPYGCMKDDIIVDGVKTSTIKAKPLEYKIMLEMFDLYSSTDISLGKLSRQLNSKGYKTSTGANWDGQKIQRILRNPIYVKADADVYMYFKNKGCNISNELSEFIGVNGCYLYGKRDRNEAKYTDVKDHVLSLALHEGFIDSSTWLSCQYKLDQNKQIKNSGKGKHSWLSGLTKCGYCNYAMTIRTYKNYKYFSCSGRINLKICDVEQRTHHVNEIELYVKDELITRLSQLKAIKHDSPKEDSYELNQLKIKLIDVEKQIDNLINQLAQSNNVLMDYINTKITELDSKKKELLEEMHQYATKSAVTSEQIFQATERVKQWDELSMEERKGIVRTFIQRVLIDNETIKIEWKS